MKKIHSFLIVGLVIAIISSTMCQVFVSAANTTNSSQSSNSLKSKYNVSVIDLVRLKNYLAGMDTDVINADYNGDKKVDAGDLTTLIKILLGIPVDSDIELDLDIDGFFNKVAKP